MIRKLTYEELKDQRFTPTELLSVDRFPIYIILENIRSMYNVGAAFRTSDAACIRELILCGYTARPPRKEIDKTALGATETVPWRHFPTALESIAYLKSKGVAVFALEHCEQSQDLMSMNATFPIALIIGNEVEGVSAEAVAACDGACEIPMYGMKQSLNASVAYGIAVFALIEKFEKGSL